MSAAPLLAIRDLSVSFDARRGPVQAVDGLSMAIRESETLALVGESGCGKSITSMSIPRLLPRSARIGAGAEIRFRGEELLQSTEKRMRALRGNEISVVFQEPMTSLNPVLKVGRQITETVRAHDASSRRVATARAEALLDRVGLPDAAGAWPHELSGGMRQRAMIAMALVCGPSLLIADEPTTALDVTVQAEILTLLATLQQEAGMGMLLVTHDLGVAAQVADRVAVMYAGQIVEEGSALSVLSEPTHPYTEALIRSVPDPDLALDRLPAIPGSVPTSDVWPAACRFEPRCHRAFDKCRVSAPEFDAGSRCWLER